MSTPVATVIVPTFDHGATIELTVASALRQTMPVEVLIIGDGVPDSHKVYMEQLVRGDARVRFLDHPKDPRRGEPYRHEALTQARGHIVTGTDYVNEGPMGTTFTARALRETTVGPYPAIVPSLSGQAWITGMANYMIDPTDPFGQGFTLSDIWA